MKSAFENNDPPVKQNPAVKHTQPKKNVAKQLQPKKNPAQTNGPQKLTQSAQNVVPTAKQIPKAGSTPKQTEQPSTATNGSKDNGANSQKKRVGECAYDFEAMSESELNLKAGDIVDISDRSDPEWWYGTCRRTGDSGYFPKNYVRKYRPPQATASPRDAPSPRADEKPRSNTTNILNASAPLPIPTNSGSVGPKTESTSPAPLSKSGSSGVEGDLPKTKLKMNLMALPKGRLENEVEPPKSPKTKEKSGFFSNLFKKKKREHFFSKLSAQKD